MKLVQKGARPISGNTGLKKIQELAESNLFSSLSQGSYKKPLDHDISLIFNRVPQGLRKSLSPLLSIKKSV
ncbi:hypothetical protein BJP44_09020 [Candidatus Williamhamiltonella defendens]|nr:hypothetical protein BJP44_09020 [Candidatus Hamiltonella defensa]ATW31481.1 hypothetical protein BJP42_03175 [Candidatus Hamiltonella defensa]